MFHVPKVFYYATLFLAIVLDSGCAAGWIIHQDPWAYVQLGRFPWAQVALIFANIVVAVMVALRVAYMRAMRYPYPR